MGRDEARLRAMLSPDSLADWGLSDADREAIAWSLARIKALEDEVNRRRGEQVQEYNRVDRVRSKVRAAIATLDSALGD